MEIRGNYTKSGLLPVTLSLLGREKSAETVPPPSLFGRLRRVPESERDVGKLRRNTGKSRQEDTGKSRRDDMGTNSVLKTHEEEKTE